MVIPSLFTEIAILMIQEMGGTCSLWSNSDCDLLVLHLTLILDSLTRKFTYPVSLLVKSLHFQFAKSNDQYSLPSSWQHLIITLLITISSALNRFLGHHVFLGFPPTQLASNSRFCPPLDFSLLFPSFPLLFSPLFSLFLSSSYNHTFSDLVHSQGIKYFFILMTLKYLSPARPALLSFTKPTAYLILPHLGWASLVAQLVKNLPAMRETWI